MAFPMRLIFAVTMALSGLTRGVHAAESFVDLCEDYKKSKKSFSILDQTISFSESALIRGGCKVVSEKSGAALDCLRFGILRSSTNEVVFNCEVPGGNFFHRTSLEPFSLMTHACYDTKVYDFESRTLFGCRNQPIEYTFYNAQGQIAIPATCQQEIKLMPNQTIVCFKSLTENEIPVYKRDGRPLHGESEDVCKFVADDFSGKVSDVGELSIGSYTFLFWKQKDSSGKIACYGNHLSGARPNTPEENKTPCSEIRIKDFTATCYEATSGGERIVIDATPVDPKALAEVRLF